MQNAPNLTYFKFSGKPTVSSVSQLMILFIVFFLLTNHKSIQMLPSEYHF